MAGHRSLGSSRLFLNTDLEGLLKVRNFGRKELKVVA